MWQRNFAITLKTGKCAQCDESFDIKEMEADHIDPWVEGGKTEEDNCQLLCREDNRRKSSK
ncbi:MAG: HNH endonuclease [Candidatus Dadabacteria bacterium]|nr:HNH endonuclease [Candidatus Dadabacteria bacterium]